MRACCPSSPSSVLVAVFGGSLPVLFSPRDLAAFARAPGPRIGPYAAPRRPRLVLQHREPCVRGARLRIDDRHAAPQLLGAGEVPLAWAYNFRLERMKSDGAPVDWIETFDPIVVTISGLGLSAKASNPNSGKLLIDFATSKRGQQMVRGMRRIPARTDIEPLAPKMDQSKLKLKAVPKEVYLHLDDHAREFRKIFGM